jgi:hypothetical protein
MLAAHRDEADVQQVVIGCMPFGCAEQRQRIRYVNRSIYTAAWNIPNNKCRYIDVELLSAKLNQLALIATGESAANGRITPYLAAAIMQELNKVLPGIAGPLVERIVRNPTITTAPCPPQCLPPQDDPRLQLSPTPAATGGGAPTKVSSDRMAEPLAKRPYIDLDHDATKDEIATQMCELDKVRLELVTKKQAFEKARMTEQTDKVATKPIVTRREDKDRTAKALLSTATTPASTDEPGTSSSGPLMNPKTPKN